MSVPNWELKIHTDACIPRSSMEFVYDLEHHRDQILLLLRLAVGDATLQRHCCEQTSHISKLSK